ncbi:MAG: efflux RND transporter periplasmic adaptor subunit [Vicinamibacteria bacterium]
MIRRSLVLLVLLLVALACRRADPPVADLGHAEGESWAVTAWGERYEVFAETDALVAGRAVTSNAHVTMLSDFSPLKAGVVSAVLRGPGGRQEVFRQATPRREGIFPVEIRPSTKGAFDLLFLIEGAGEKEEIAAGRVQVGSASAPGGRADAPEEADASVSFLKEQQWRTEFATAWVEQGSLHEGVAGPGRVLPARGGSVVLTAPVDAIVAPEPWPFTGLDVAAARAVFRLQPRTSGRSLPELIADAAGLEAEADAARKRVERLGELLRLEATSAAELERARAALAGVEARLTASRRGVAVASGGVSQGEPLDVPAPWAGRVAEVMVSPGQSVAAGAVLGRLVKARPLWIEVALRPEDAPRLRGGPAGLILRLAGRAEPVEIGGRAVRLVAIAPEVDPRTSTIAATFELDLSASELPIGSAAETEVLLAGERRGLVVPRSALIDDAGLTIAYVQGSGEGFERREVRILARQATRVLVEGLRAGERLVIRGGAAIRRSSLLSSGAPEGHVH